MENTFKDKDLRAKITRSTEGKKRERDIFLQHVKGMCDVTCSVQ